MNPDLVEIFNSFLSENYTAIARKNQDGEIIYWALRYRKSPTDKTLNSVVAGTISVSDEKLFVHSRNDDNPSIQLAIKGLKEAFEDFSKKYPELSGKYDIS